MAQTIRIDNNCKRANALFDAEYRRGTRNRVNPIITIKARSMRRNKERQERRQFHARKNAKLTHLIRCMRNCRELASFFRKFALPRPPRTSSLSEIYASLTSLGTANQAGLSWLPHQPAGKVRGRGKSSASRDP